MNIQLFPKNVNVPDEPLQKGGGGISLELGDIIRIEAPTNDELNEQTFYVIYIDTDIPDSTSISIVNIANFDKKELRILNGSYLSDESITNILLLARNPERGYARQNKLVPDTWIDIQFGGEFPTTITGQITNLEDDMIEVTTYPAISVIYIDFGYRGIPPELPIKEIVIREKPPSVSGDLSAPISFNSLEKGEIAEEASMEYTDTGEVIISIPPNAKINENMDSVLQQLYLEGDDIFGEELGNVLMEVEVPESQKRYGIETQTESLMDGLLENIPMHKRTKQVLDNVHRLIERFKELRQMYSVLDSNGNIKEAKQLNPVHIPLHDKLLHLNVKVPWLIPVVSNTKCVYSENQMETDAPDIENYVLADILREDEEIQKTFSNKEIQGDELRYEKMVKRTNAMMVPYNADMLNADKAIILKNARVNQDIECIVENIPNMGSTARRVNTEGGIEDMVKKYSILRHTSGTYRPHKTDTQNGGKVFSLKKIAPADKADIHSFLMLPKEAVFFSRGVLPGTNMLLKTNIGRTQLEPYRFLHKKTKTNVYNIIDLNKKIQYSELNTPENDENTASKKNQDKSNSQLQFLNNLIEFAVNPEIPRTPYTYSETLYNILPDISTCINYMEKYTTDNISMAHIVKLLEPFHVYFEDINYSQYNQLRYFMKNKITSYHDDLKTNSTEYNQIFTKINKSFDTPNIINSIFSDKKAYLEFLTELYLLNMDKLKTFSSSELLFYMEKLDGSSLLYSLITRAFLSLYTPDTLMKAFQAPAIEDMSAVDKIRPKDCSRRFLAKKYASIADLQKDNNTDELFYDKDMDDTPYHILKKYDKQKGKMSSETFVEFLEENLIQKHECNANLAKELAQTLIAGKKRVSEGEYAIVENTDDSMVTADYFVRKNNNWVKDNTISESAFIDTQSLFCNIQDKCYKNTTNNQCNTMEQADYNVHRKSNDLMLKELKKRVSLSMEDLQKEIDDHINYSKKYIYNISVLRELDLYRQNNMALDIASKGQTVEDKLVSPHAKVLDMILSLNDFVRQQKDIVWFYNEYCRTPNPNENMAWMYCKDTNTTLMPVFLYLLAEEFVEGGDYQGLLDRMCSKAELSDDGDYYVDKETGFPLKKRDFVNEDEYDDAGFKITTNAILEKDLGTIVSEALAKKVRVFDNETDQMVYNVFMALIGASGIPPENIEEFTLRVSFELIRNPAVIMEEEKYKQRAAKLEKDTGKTSIVYPIYKNQAIISIIAGVLLVAVQCVIPSIKTRKTFPGCVKSFSGYPLSGGTEDVSGLKYIACLINSIKYDEEPWKSVMKLSSPLIATRIRDVLEKHILKRNDVNELYVQKKEFLLLHPEEEVPKEHSIEKWRGFLPPVVEFSVISTLHNVAADFKSHLLETLKKGHKDQFSQLGVVRSRIHAHTYGILENIYNIVKNKTSLLNTSGGVPFLENACCNDRNKSTHPLSYFEGQNPAIMQYVTIANELSKMFNEVRIFTKPSILYHVPSTAIVRVEIPNTPTEKNIYETIIHYAKFDRTTPIPEGLVNICGEKPVGYKSTWSIDEKIEYLKKHGKRYDQTTLNQVMEYVHTQNLVPLSFGENYNQAVKLVGFLESMDLIHSEVIPEPLRELMLEAIRAYKPKEMKKDGSVKEIIQLRKYLAKTNEQMLKEIINLNRGSFIKSYGNLNARELKQLQDFMANIHIWNMDTPDAGYNGIYTVTQFIKNSVEAMTKVYPSMVMNNASYTEVHKHWGLSKNHETDISRVLKKYIEGLNKFKNDKTLHAFLLEVQKKTVDIHLLLQHIPMETPISKNDTTYFELFDKKTLYYLHIYCWYSVLYEYMNLASDRDLLYIDIQDTKRDRRNQNKEASNVSNSLSSIFSSSSEETEEAQADLYEVEIRAGEKEALQKRVCELMVTFLQMEERNKKTLDKPYAEIAKRVRRSKEEEKKAITDYLKNMYKDELKVEDLLKQLHLGRWNVGIQKGIFVYDKNVYNNERTDAILRLNQDLEMDNDIEHAQIDVDVEQLELAENAENDEFYDREAVDIAHFGDDYMDGNYYGEDGDDDFAYDD